MYKKIMEAKRGDFYITLANCSYPKMINKGSIGSEHEQHDESSCWHQLMEGDRRGLEGLYVQFSRELFSYGMAVERDRSLIKDCIQESIEKVMVQLRFKEEPIETVFAKIEKASGFSFVNTNRDIRNLPKVSSEGKSLYDLLKGVVIEARLEFKQVNHSILVQKSKNEAAATVVTIVEDDIVIVGLVTDANGRYTLSVPEGATLVYSFIGFESQQVTVGNQPISILPWLKIWHRSMKRLWWDMEQ